MPYQQEANIRVFDAQLIHLLFHLCGKYQLTDEVVITLCSRFLPFDRNARTFLGYLMPPSLTSFCLVQLSTLKEVFQTQPPQPQPPQPQPPQPQPQPPQPQPPHAPHPPHQPAAHAPAVQQGQGAWSGQGSAAAVGSHGQIAGHMHGARPATAPAQPGAMPLAPMVSVGDAPMPAAGIPVASAPSSKSAAGVEGGSSGVQADKHSAKRKADDEGTGGADGAKKAKADSDDPVALLSGAVDEAAEAKAMKRTKFSRKCLHQCTDVPFLQYDKDGPRRVGPLVQHLEALLARHKGDVHYMDNLAIDLLSLACEQHMRTTIERLVEASRHRSGRSPAFAALGDHNSLRASSAVEPAAASAAASDVVGEGPRSHVHASLQEQDAARCASAPPLVPPVRRATLTSAAGWIQEEKRSQMTWSESQGKTAGTSGHPQALSMGMGGAGGHEGGVHAHVDQAVVSQSGAGGGTNAAVAAGMNGADDGRLRVDYPGPGQDGIVLKDMLFLLENEKRDGMRRIFLQHAVRQDPALKSWRSPR